MATRVVLAAIVLAALAAWPAAAAPSRWQPRADATWQIQFSGRLDMTVDADVFDLDLFDTPISAVSELHAAGRRVVCYINAGAWESWRPDASRYARSVKGKKLDGWPGEKWLDIRRLGVLGPILKDRLDLCVAKGFDGVEFDNVNGYTNPTGFNLRRADQLAFNRWLAAESHERGLAVGLKNALELADELEPVFDFAILEQCFVYRECALAAPFIDAGKAVLDVEYDLARRRFCGRAADLGITAMRKHLELDAWRAAC
ncbi:MAG: endo alpha-1,4 polygalactosaminidase [Chloroflexota bacterium]